MSREHGRDICGICGGERGIHRYDTMQCPAGGYDQTSKKVKVYENTVFTLKEDTVDDLKKRITALEDTLKLIKQGCVEVIYQFEPDFLPVCPHCNIRVKDISKYKDEDGEEVRVAFCGACHRVIKYQITDE